MPTKAKWTSDPHNIDSAYTRYTHILSGSRGAGYGMWVVVMSDGSGIHLVDGTGPVNEEQWLAGPFDSLDDAIAAAPTIDALRRATYHQTRNNEVNHA